MAKPELTVLDGGKEPPRPARPPRAKSLLAAVADGDEVAELKALRALLAKRLADPKTSAVAIAALTKQFRELGEQIAAAERAGSPASTDGSSAGDADLDDEPWDDDI